MPTNVDYDKIWKDDWKDITSFGPSYRTRYRLIKKLMKKYDLNNGDLLDVGCGDGTLLLSLKQTYPKLRLYGFDVSSFIVKKYKSKIKLSVGDLTDKKTLPKKKFDIIICSEVLEHIKEYKKAIANLSSLLKPKGIVIITSPYGMKNWTVHDDYAHHERRWETGQIDKELKKNKVRIMESMTWGRLIYYNYYKYWLAHQDPKKLVTQSNGVIKRMGANFLYHVFKFDDLFKSNGRIVVIVGQKG